MPKSTFPVVSFKQRTFTGHVYIVPGSIAAIVEDPREGVGILLNNGVFYGVEGGIKEVLGAIHEITDMKGETGPRGGR